MQLIIEQIFDQVRGTWRFRWWALLVATLVSVLGWLGVFLIPNTYQASARVFVDTSTALSEVTRGISVELDVETQIQRVRQVLLGGPQLLKVGDETGLFAGIVTPREKEASIEELRKRIDIKGGGTGGSGSVYVISYENSDRDMTIKVVDKLLNTFVEGTLGGKREGSAKAQEFLVTQIRDIERRLADSENRLAEFKRQNVALMPGAQGDYFTRLRMEIEASEKAKRDLQAAARRQEALRRQLRGEQPFINAADGPSSAQLPTAPTATNSDTGIRIREARARRDELLLRFTEKHPEVIGLASTISELEQRQATEIAAARRGDSGAAARIGLNANPVFQQIQLQYNQTEVEIATLRADLAARERSVTELRGLVSTAPQVEAEFAQLNRDYAVTQAQYEALLQRLERARLGDEAEQKGVVQFEVIDPPTAKFEPVAPNRPLLIAFVLIVGLGAGGGVAYLMHLLQPVFYGEQTLAAAAGVPVLGSISMTWLEQHRSSMLRANMRFAAAVVILIAVGVSVLLAESRLSAAFRSLVA